MHALLVRQLKAHLGIDDLSALPSGLLRFVAAVEETYRDSDVDRHPAHRLQTLGELTAALAHEINTPIQYAGDNVEFLRQSFADLDPLFTLINELPAASPMRQLAEKIQLSWMLKEVPSALAASSGGLHKVSELIRVFKQLAGPESTERAPMDLNQTLWDTVAVAHSQLKYVARVKTELGTLPKVHCRSGAMNQAFFNLLASAGQAISKKGPEMGEIEVTSRLERTGVVVTVRDNGVGIPEGEGLAVARSIVEEHGGTLERESVAGKGSTFWVRLPLDGIRQEAA
jgi:two-component system NtrC family sensor kinase